MSGRNPRDLRRSKRVKDQGSRPSSANASGRNTPDPRSQPTVDPHIGDLSITDTRFSGQSTPYEHHIADLYGGQRFSVPQPTPYSTFTGQATPDQQRITDPHGGQPILQAPYGGYPAPYYNSPPAVYPRFGDRSIADPRFSGQSTPYQQRIANPYGDQHFPVPQPYPSFSVQTPPYQQRTPGPYREYFSAQPAPGPRSGPSTSDPQRIPGPYPSGQHAPHPRSGGQTTYDPRGSGQRPPDQRSRNRPTPDPRTSGLPNQQYTTDPNSGGQHILEPNFIDHPINSGIYTITNVHHHRRVYLEDGNDSTPLVGQYRPVNHNTRWHVRNYGNGQYSIENVDHKRYAYCGSRAGLKAFVEGNSKEQLWRIQAATTGEYTIATTDTKHLWMLPYDDPDTPIELFNVYTDRRCWWAFNSAETTAPVDENPTTQDPKRLLASSGGQPIPEAAIVEFTSAITEAINLLHPLGAACKSLRVVLQRAERNGHGTKARRALIKRLRFQLATVENDIAKLEEDQRIDETIPALNQDVRGSLESYSREIKEIYELLSENQLGKGIIAQKTLKIDETFQKYTAALHQFAANTVAQIQQQLARFRQEFQHGALIAAEKAHPDRPNTYGIQHRDCLQGTREKTLPAISDWIDDENSTKWMFFLLDVAGSGKSTVAKHMAEKWTREKRLLARFFFSRDTAETMSTSSFCSTVAGAFSALDPTYKEHMDKFTEHPNVELLSFKERFEGLVAGPLRAIGRRAILIIDALDECDARQRDELLETLRDQHSSIPFLRVLATGRPERDIKRWAEERFGFGYMNFSRLEENEKDVELYIKHMLRDVPDIQGRLYPVISGAEGLFIWARIACDLLLDSDDIDGLLEELGKEVSLDYLYKVALEQSMPKEGASRRAMVMVLQMILAAKEPLSIAELEMLSPKPGVVERIVTRLGSVLLYQSREDPIRLLHATFREFLTTRSKANIFFIQPKLGHHMLASGCLTTIHDSPQHNPTRQEVLTISQRKEISFEPDIY